MQEYINDKLQYVLRHYRRGMFDPVKGIVRFMEKTGTSRAWKTRRAIRLLAAAAVAAIVLAFGLNLYQTRIKRWEETAASSVVLPDRSVVRLKDGSTLAFQPRRFAKARTVRLNGTAYFEVTGSSIPFQVLSEDACVRVLGTKFQFDADRGTVDLLEGSVMYARQNSEKGLRMTGASRAILPEGSDIPVFTDPEYPNPAVWATGRLVYDAVPLGIVLNELSSVFGKEIKAAPASASGMSLTAEFLVSDGLEHILNAIESALRIDTLSYE